MICVSMQCLLVESNTVENLVQTLAMPVCFCQVDIGMSYHHFTLLETDFLDCFEILRCSCCTVACINR